jgi:Domain of unknown function (DUF1772)
MSSIMQVATLLLVALAMVPAVAHALEFPGKKRLPKETYLAIQPIYYPGFTIVGGIGEFGGMLATFALLFITPRETSAFWLTVSAFIALLVMHGIFWTFTQPVNKVWLRDQQLPGAARSFFGTNRQGGSLREADWWTLRDRWEYSHIARAVMVVVALLLLASALAVN